MKKHSNDLIGDIVKAFGKYADRPAFVIEDTACTYGELATCVQKISSLFKREELFTDTIDNFDTYRGYVDKFINSSQWDPERLAFMDVIIMCTAISELLNYPAIPIPVTLNEYIEIANSYSTPRSGQFINGILYSVISHLQEEGKLLKK